MRNYILGIYDGTHDAGATLLCDGKVISASNEERFLGQKGAGGWPKNAVDDCLTHLPLNADCSVAFAGCVNPNPILRLCRSKQSQWRLDDGKYFSTNDRLSDRWNSWLQHQSPFPYMRSDDRLTRLYLPSLTRVLKRQLKSHHGFQGTQISLEDHHHCHAAAGHFTSGWAETLVMVADGVGDGISTSIWLGNKGVLKRIACVPYPHSLGLFFASVTGHLGYRPFRHEGKLVGMAARGNPNNIPVPFPVKGQLLKQELTVKLGRPLKIWLKQLERYRPEDVAAWLQQGLTHAIEPTLRWWIQQTGRKNIVLVGGIFANVELNRVLLEAGGQNHYIFPHMGDGGLATGAATIMHHRYNTWQPQSFSTLALGPDLDIENIETVIQQHKLQRVETEVSAEKILAKRLAEGQIVARAADRMEYGPRALGNRSILAPATCQSIHKELNQRLQRSEVMPFAPILLEDDLEEWVTGIEHAQKSLPWMTVNVKAKPKLISACPAIVHVDGTLRPQVVNARRNPNLYELLHKYRSHTAIPALINTSFNMHEHPIVRQVSDAVIAAKQANINTIQLGKRVYQY